MQTVYQIAEVKLTYKTSVKTSERFKISNSADCYKIFLQFFDADTIEHKESAWALFLNQSNQVISITKISEGSVNATLIDPKLIFQAALLVNAISVIIAHNHPSGNLTASLSDRQMTKKLADAAKVLEMNLLDHLVITNEGYYSFADDGRM